MGILHLAEEAYSTSGTGIYPIDKVDSWYALDPQPGPLRLGLRHRQRTRGDRHRPIGSRLQRDLPHQQPGDRHSAPGRRGSGVRIRKSPSATVFPSIPSAPEKPGYGSRVPTSGQAAILDLARLNRIVDFSEALGTVTVEAGVTFAQLENFLEEQKSQRFMSSPAYPVAASPIGNALERGWGFGPYSDCFDFMCGMQVVLPDGEVVETGLERFPGSKSSKIFRWGVGPWFDGMFTQSNLGVVTRMTIFLAPKPTHFISFLYRFNDVERLAPLMDNLRELKMRGILRTNFKVQNFYRKLMDRGAYPWDETGGKWCLSPETGRCASASRRWAPGTEPALSIAGPKPRQREREMVEEALLPYVDHVLFLDQETLERKDELRDQVKEKTGYNLDSCLHRYYVNTRFIGVDKGLGVGGAYWRKRTGMPENPDPDKDRVGFIWVDPILPFLVEVRQATDLAASVQRKHGFDDNLGMNCVTERSIFMTAAIIYDRDVAGDDERALACAQDLTHTMMGAGYTLGRLTTFNMDVLSLRLRPVLKNCRPPSRRPWTRDISWPPVVTNPEGYKSRPALTCGPCADNPGVQTPGVVGNGPA